MTLSTTNISQSERRYEMKKTSISNLPFQRGISLIEIMVSLTITLILTLGLANVYLGSKRSYVFQENLSIIQENGRFAIEQIGRDIRMAGFISGECGSISDLNNIIKSSIIDDLSEAEKDFINTFSSSGFVSGTRTNGQDTIRLTQWTRTDPGFYFGTNNYNPKSSQFFLDDHDYNLNTGDIILVTDCKGNGDLFKASNVQEVGGSGKNRGTNVVHAGNFNNPSPKLDGDYTNGGYLMRFQDFQMIEYRVQNGALERRQPSGNWQELIDGVVTLQAQYGLDTNGDGSVNQYDTADNLSSTTDWGQVISIRVHLLLRGRDPNQVDNIQNFMLDAPFNNAADRNLHQIVTTTVGIRNRLP